MKTRREFLVGGGVGLFNSMGNPWTADYLKVTGELDVDLRSNIAAEARAKIVYERLIDFCDDAGTKDAGRVFGAHGGALDRLDAVIFTVIAGYYVWRAVGGS